MPASLDIRPMEDSEFEACERMKAELFSIPFTPERLEHVRPVRELDRIYVASAGTAIVGSIAANSFTMAVPGGAVKVAGISGLGLRPQYDGLAPRLRLLERQLRAARKRAEPLAALCALMDVPPIYDRVGFGIASKGCDLRIDAGHAVIRAAAGPAGPVTEAPAGELRPIAEVSYRQLEAAVPGVVGRGEAQWHRWAGSNLKPGTRCLVAGSASAPTGYAVLSPAPATAGDSAPLSVRELVAVTPADALALWSAIFARAADRQVRASHRPADDPLQWLIADPRKLVRTAAEGIWIRLVDVTAALEARAFAAPVDVVVRIRDESCPWNDETFRIGADGGRASVRLCGDEPELEVAVEALGSAYLGSARLSALAGTGLVAVRDAGALRALDTALSWPVAAWAPTRF